MAAVQHADATKTLYPMTQEAITVATKTLTDDLVLKLNHQYNKSRNTFIGNVGRQSFAQTLPSGGRYKGIRLRPVDVSDAVITLTRFMLIGNATGNLTVRLMKAPYKSAIGTEVTSWVVPVVANAYATNTLATALKLPLVENSEAVEYWLYYDTEEIPGGFRPKDNTIECSTCPKQGGPRLTDYLDADGVDFEDPAGGLNFAVPSSYSNGFILDVAIKCDNESLFCREYNQDDAVAVTMAWATLYKGGELLIESVLKSTDINRFTTQNREYLWGKRNHFRAQYEERLTYLAATIDVTASNCYVCRNLTNQPFHATIFS